jgi:hypothetical protein
MKKKSTVFVLILASYILIGPPLGSLIFMAGIITFASIMELIRSGFLIDVSHFSETLGIVALFSYLFGGCSALFSGTYLAWRASAKRVVSRMHYYMAAAFAPAIASGYLLLPGSKGVTLGLITTAVALSTAWLFLFFSKRILRRTPYALQFSNSTPNP